MADDIEGLGHVADYQFGAGAGNGLFADPDELSVTRTSSGRPRQIHCPDGRIGTYESDGRFRLGLAGGRRLQEILDSPAYRVVVGDESEPYIREGRNVFAKFVSNADEAIRPRDEVLVEHTDGSLLAVGRAELSGQGMAAFETGMAVKVRDGTD
ncbi:PUA domain-containing protein [Halobacteriaceae archaeon SHR40]|uniref:PUA domain-containing protein n=1 Tax=Halovenus amylolytica TaxID=2500550 RepID=UPI000FE2C47B